MQENTTDTRDKHEQRNIRHQQSATRPNTALERIGLHAAVACATNGHASKPIQSLNIHLFRNAIIQASAVAAEQIAA